MNRDTNFSIRGKIALIDADLLDNGTRHPNLAIMKLSSFFKSKDCQVKLIEEYESLCVDNYKGANEYDAIYISKVFTSTKVNEGLLKLTHVFVGGTGFFEDGGADLPAYIEHIMPDYSIYNEYIENNNEHKNKYVYFKDYLDYSIGFATRGCFRKCEFCVNKKYDKVSFHSHVNEWVDSNRKKIYLWDDNIFAYEKWEEVFEELNSTGKPFQFRQGLDIRLLTADKAKVLTASKYYGDIIFAFDHIEDKELIEKKLELWRSYSKKGTKLYVLSGFASQDEKEVESVFERISVIIKYGCLPYIMRHQKYENSPYRGLFVQIARWCNQPQFLKKMSFRQFCEANQKYHKNKETLCAAYKSMIDFEAKHPDIAKKYFDMRFEEQEYYLKNHPNK